MEKEDWKHHAVPPEAFEEEPNVLEDIRDELQSMNSEIGNIANSLSWVKAVIIGLCIFGGIYLIRDIIKWFTG